MKTTIFTMLFAAASLIMGAQTYYFDFGGSGSRGTLTTNPDDNGNYWNNIAPETESAQTIAAKTSFDNLLQSDGSATEASLVLCNAWGVNSAGGLTSPSADLLGDLAVATATTDYMFNTNNSDGGRSFVIRGLDSTKAYRFTIFGTRSASDTRIGRYTITGENGWATTMQVAGTGIGANGENQNTDTTPVSDLIYPDASGNITFYLCNETTTYVPISCMKMETVDATREYPGTVTRTLLFDFGSSGATASRGSQTDGNWNNIINNSGNYCAAGSEFANLIDTEGVDTGATLTVDMRFSTNGYTSGGGLTSPSANDLGDLAVETATYDYFYTETGETDRTMTFTGLDPQKSYRFHIFGSRSNAECRLGLYHLEGLNEAYGAQQVAGNNFNDTAGQNTKNILISDPVFPTADGTIVLTVINNAKTYVALSCMKIEELTDVTRPDIVTVTSVTLTGDNLIDGELTSFASTDRTNWQLWAKLPEGEIPVTVVTDKGTSTVTATIPSAGIYQLTYNADTDEITTFECTYLCVEGSAVGGWNTTGVELTYIGQGQWSYHGLLDGYDKTSDSGRVNFVMNKSWSYQYKRVSGSTSQLALNSGEDIPLNPGNYKITLDLNAMTWEIANGADTLDPLRITVMGSSVSNGQGADNNEGYAYMYDNLLNSRYLTQESDNAFYISNIAINGNSSVSLLNRYDDLQREYGSYVIYAISLGNEGIHGASDQQAIYDQFKTNMQSLISRARADGKTPVVMNNYTRADFTADDYTYIKRMNEEIARWDVPSINMLGAIDNGSGQWASGYDISTDIYHPNTAGHREFFYAMVPSMFDALASGKTLTMNRVSDSTLCPLAQGQEITITPEATVHSFTVAMTSCATEAAQIIKVTDSSDNAITLAWDGTNYVVKVGDDSKITYAPKARATVNEIVLTHNYAAQQLALILDGESVGTATLEFEPVEVTIGDSNATANISVGEIMFYRSSMMTNYPFADSQLNKSSLEVYSSLTSDTPTGTLPNLAMSTNAAQYRASLASSIASNSSDLSQALKVVPGTGSITITASHPTKVIVANPLGQVLHSVNVDGTLRLDGFRPGIYFINNIKTVVK
ncbi:MAG: SGNH/GDSL hydrolase family protein [Bacteroidales bacterium]|nr:SGNH/GDSL hydrolase family protein [Bacteroidales bacterium]